MKSNEVKALCIHICHDCNMRCRYCFADGGDYKRARGLMSYECGCRAIDFLLEKSKGIKNLELDFFGGEFGHKIQCHTQSKRNTVYADFMKNYGDELQFLEIIVKREKDLSLRKRVELKRYIMIPLRWIMWTLRAGVSRLLLTLLSYLQSTHWVSRGNTKEL